MRHSTIQQLRDARSIVREWVLGRKRVPSEKEIQRQVQKWIAEGYSFRTLEMAFMTLYAEEPELEERMRTKHLLPQIAA